MDRTNSHRGRAPTRAPAPAGIDVSGMGDIIRSQQQQYSPRHVPQGQYMPRAYSPASAQDRAYSAASSMVRPSSPALDRGQVPAGVRLIKRDADGKFDLESLEGETFLGETFLGVGSPGFSSRPSTPVSMTMGSSSKHGRDASNASSGFNSILGKFTAGHSKNNSAGTTTSNASSGSFLKRSNSRSGAKPTYNAPPSPRPGSRRGSFKDFIRRGSQEISHAAEIVMMHPSERDNWLGLEKEKMAEEMRQAKAVTKTIDEMSRKSAELKARMEAMKAKRAADVAQQAEWARERDQRNATHDAKMEKYKADLARLERFHDEDKENGTISGPVLSSGDLTNHGPYCERCGRTSPYLRNELCDWCHKAHVAGKIEKLDDFFEQETLLDSEEHDEASDYNSSRSSSIGYRPVNEEEYMKTAVDRRIRRVRRTIYDDPGNPFTFGQYDNELTVPMLYQRSRDNSPAPAEPSTYGMQPRLELSDSPASMAMELEGVIHNVNSPDVGEERFGRSIGDRGTPLPAPRPRRTGTPTLVRAESVREAASHIDAPEAEGYVPAKELWRNSLPVGMSADGYPRNTVFYGFYDSVLQDYRASQHGKS